MKLIANIIKVVGLNLCCMLLLIPMAGAASKGKSGHMTLYPSGAGKFHQTEKPAGPDSMMHSLSISKPEGTGDENVSGPLDGPVPPGDMEIVQGDDVHMPQPKGGYFLRKSMALKNGLEPVGGLAQGSETIDQPILDRTVEGMAHESAMPQDALESPINDMVDPDNLPGPDRGDPPPSAEDKENLNSRYTDWSHSRSNHCIPETWDAFTERKVENWGGVHGHPRTNWDPSCNPHQKGNEKPQDSTDNGGTDTVDKDKPGEDELPGEVETGAKPEAEKDSDPEGDDPDELRSPVASKAAVSPAVSMTPVMDERHLAAARSQQSAMGNGGAIGSTPQTTPQGQGGGLPSVNLVEIQGVPDPEDGGPDEMTSPASNAVSHAMASGQTHMPEPGGDDPDDPRASEGGNTTVMGTMDYAASPSEDGDSGVPAPTDPRF